ncbi:hypothetical protein N7530_004563 [Penicillium desertorum]|uniref:Uncharacterized protein n=1 Tax=Penicillium desertorum TaxID=1303715 RepID=A0A9W9WYI5_9EURO|nr:hypothetical protein N7530_004563 [Penicillium desertorum]
MSPIPTESAIFWLWPKWRWFLPYVSDVYSPMTHKLKVVERKDSGLASCAFESQSRVGAVLVAGLEASID